MKVNRETKRLYVGGLSQNISEADLQNQFSRFGEVSDVEIITRKDDQGNPQKVFAYINISVAEADLKKCMSVLNKTKWKGGTLQIQLAKESFLHRLAQEREEAKAKKEKSTTGNTNLLEKIGGVDFHMKAVPGTEVPGHKNWVVSKFGRVLPVLHLKNQHKRKVIKYDPSKYCHNLKKIGEDFTNTIPISSLTWELEGGNDPMSKKRRGEFSDFHGPPKKVIKVQKDESSIGSLAMSTRPRRVIERPPLTQQQAAEKRTCDSITASKSSPVPVSDTQKLKNLPFKTSGLETAKKRNSISDDDIDSEDELRMMIAKEENLQRTTQPSINESENEPFEVVRDDFKSGIHKLHSLIGLGIKNNVSCHDSDDDIMRNDTEYDSGDTDEIIAMKKNVAKVKNITEFSQMEKSTKKISLKNRENCELSDHCIKLQKRKSNVESALGRGLKSLNRKSPSNSSSSEDADSASELADSEGDEEYNAMMKNCLRVNLTLADLEQLAGSDLKVPNGDTESNGPETSTRCKFDRGSKSPKAPTCLRRGQQCIHPEEIVASLLEGEENTCGKQKPKENNLKPKFQAFKGIGCLYEKESMKKSLKDNVASNNINKDQNSMKHEDPSIISMEDGSPYVNGSSGELTACQHAKKANGPNYIQPQKRQTTFESQDRKAVSPRSSENRSTNPISGPLEGNKSLSLSAKTHNIGFDKDSCHSTTKTEASEEERSDSSSLTSLKKSPKVSSKDTWEIKTDFSLSISNSSDLSAKGKHAEDNEKRLAALEARQKAKEMQKKLVHNALAKLESVGKTSGKLFDSSDDEESDSEDDSNRFKIKPQFEGRAGQKLMDLQSHFGTDDRFRMDSRFLESDSEEEQEEVNEKKTAEEEELAEEKKKALNVVQSVLQINLSNSTNKGSVAAKKFKDIIHYDPTKQDHATYERKRDDKPKESKAKRKKKREEAEKLPEVSKEMYYNIAMDLKEIFQTTKYTSEKEEDTPWNEDCAKEKPEEIQGPAALTSGAEQPSGFTFSFFDSDIKDIKEETYKVETVKPGKIVWQEDPRFQDSSSEEEDVTEETDHRKSSPGEAPLLEKETTRFFFFSKNDERLQVGSDLFWRGVGSNISRNSWEARTNNLRMDCRKKHKDAKRKMKPK
ncbi:nucleolar protein 8 isoform X4 [Papio anubis]|uniref:nucleolar protein 8 isoform X4 n=1 Tax=Papio anubis TaxID=9555 RepID=UPI0012ADF76D|nr:nucleolar protein 8 isoform X4 [Papio anubis]